MMLMRPTPAPQVSAVKPYAWCWNVVRHCGINEIYRLAGIGVVMDVQVVGAGSITDVLA